MFEHISAAHLAYGALILGTIAGLGSSGVNIVLTRRFKMQAEKADRYAMGYLVVTAIVGGTLWMNAFWH